MSEHERQEIPVEEYYKVEEGKPYPARARWAGEYDAWEEGYQIVKGDREERIKRVRHEIRDELKNTEDQKVFDELIAKHDAEREHLNETTEWTRATLQIAAYEATAPNGDKYSIAVCFEPWYKGNYVYGTDPQHIVLTFKTPDID